MGERRELREQLLELLELAGRVGDLGQRAQAVLAEEADRRLIRQAKELVLDFRSQPQQAHDLGDAHSGDAHLPGEISLGLDEGVALEETGVAPGLQDR